MMQVCTATYPHRWLYAEYRIFFIKYTLIYLAMSKPNRVTDKPWRKHQMVWKVFQNIEFLIVS